MNVYNYSIELIDNGVKRLTQLSIPAHTLNAANVIAMNLMHVSNWVTREDGYIWQYPHCVSIRPLEKRESGRFTEIG